MSTQLERNILTEYAKGNGLNIGCGDDKIKGSIGVDISPKAGGANTVANGNKLPFKDNEFDYVLASHNLEHYEESPIIILREWRRVLKPGGVCVVIVPDEVYNIAHGFPWHTQHLHIFTDQTLKLIMTYSGFLVKRAEIINREPERKDRTILCVGVKQ